MSDRKREYSELLKDPRWQKLRLQVFERDGWECQLCSSKTKTLNVHHKRYERGKNPWEYPIASLLTLCESCHKDEYESRREAEQDLLDTLRDKGVLFCDIGELSRAFKSLPCENISYEFIGALVHVITSPTARAVLLDQYFAHEDERIKQARIEVGLDDPESDDRSNPR